MSAAVRFQHPGEGELVLRPLVASDADAFGRYLEDLGAESRRRFGPHPHTMDEARRRCEALPTDSAIRYLVFRDQEGPAKVLGYFIIYPAVRPSEVKRYEGYGIALSSDTDCTFAPSIADACQGKGVGSAVMRILIEAIRELGFRRVVLSGGAQATNDQAIGYYSKFGFRKVGSFETVTELHGRLDNDDMMMTLPTE